MNPEEKEDWLDTCLRENTAYIADNGFSAQVMLALPPLKPTKNWDWRRFAVLSGMTALALAASAFQMPDPEIVLAQITMAFKLQLLGTQLLTSLIVVGGAIGASAIIGTGLAAFLQAD